jgi:hypothetical protein
MRAIATSVLMILSVALPMAARTRAASSATLVIRLYNTSGIHPSELRAARQTAGSILGDTGLDVQFRHCGGRVSPEAAIDSCDESLMPSEVVVRVINAPAFNATLDHDAYGVTNVLRDTNRGWLATVFSDRIHDAASRVGVEPGTLLGRVLAHEVAHLLLGRDYHGNAGLMRAEWPDALLTRTADEWRFSHLEAIRLQRSLD